MIDWPSTLVGFLFGVLGVGGGTGLQQRVVKDRRDAAVRRALRTEIGENIERIGPGEERTAAPRRVVRSAWDVARELRWDARMLELLAKAYAEGEDLNSRIAVVDRSLSSRSATDPGSDAYRQASRHHDILVDASHQAAKRALAAFEAARRALG